MIFYAMVENNTSAHLINELFDLLDDWRNLPAYQLERRADIFFALYLKEILEKKKGHIIKLVIPEFPLRAKDIDAKHKRPDSSFKIDYVAVGENDTDVYLIELKTDQKYRRKKQDKYLEKAKKNNIPKIIKGIVKIYQATNEGYRKKYDFLISKLININWISKVDEKLIPTRKCYNITVVYIQPRNENNDPNIISFSDICSILTESDPITERFVKSLEKWENSPDGLII